MDFKDIVRQNIREAGLPDEALLIVALSGGADSVALAESLREGGYRLVAVHCNYHLRGEESDRDASYAESFCRSRGIALRRYDFDLAGRKRLTGESTEMACRELRYDAFAKVLAETGAAAIAVGHHREDNVETFFINLLRGSGLTGLCGMKLYDSARKVVRPMLELTRAEIERYLEEREVEWVNDSTNYVSDVGRNRLRNEVLPEMARWFPDAMERISSSIELLSSNLALYNDMAGRMRETYTLSDGGVEVGRALAELAAGDASPEMILYELLRPAGFNISQCRDIASGHASTGARFTTRVGEFFYDRGLIRPFATRGDRSRLVIERVSGERFAPVRNPSVIYLDPSALAEGAILRLRPWRAGDRIRPFGMRGSRLVSDILSDAKVPLDKKGAVELLVREDASGEEKEILWVCGIRGSAHFPVTRDSQEYIKIEYK